MVNDLVSVVVPTYNRASCLQRTIDSALAQTYAALEVIVIDDGSKDETAELIRKAYGYDERVRYFYQENRGVSAARNHGMSLARGRYIALLDSDDLWKPWKLQVQVACMERAPEVGMVWTDMEAVDSHGHVFSSNYLRTMYSAYQWFHNDQLFSEEFPLEAVIPDVPGVPVGGKFYVGDIFSQMVMGNLVHTSTVLLRRERAERVKGFNEEWQSGEDYDFHLRTCREGPVGFVSVASIQYQRGMADRLSRHRDLIAKNFLATVTRVIKEDRARITLPKRMLNTVLAEANAWVGEMMASEGNYSSARRHLARSLVYRPWQSRTLGILAFCCVPSGVNRGLRGLYRELKRFVRRSDTAELARKGG